MLKTDPGFRWLDGKKERQSWRQTDRPTEGRKDMGGKKHKTKPILWQNDCPK